MLPATASCTPWRATRKAVDTRILGSAVSDEVSLLVWRQATPRSRTTSCTAKEPDEASASISSSQPVLLTSSRVRRAASWGCPFESRKTNSIGRPRKPPLALMRSCSIVSALREEVPSRAIGPDRMLCIPIRSVLACALATQGAANRLAVLPATIVRRVKSLLMNCTSHDLLSRPCDGPLFLFGLQTVDR